MNNKTTNEFKMKYNISEEVCKGLNVLGYYKPTPVQGEVIPHILEEKDLIVQSQTGSGKTAAFGVPVVEQIDVDENLPQVLMLTPTRELAVQVCEEISNIGKYKKIRSLPIYGKQAIHVQLRQLKQRVHVVVGTPGRMADLIKKKHLKLDNIKYLVIDEADELLRRGFIEEVDGIINKIPTNPTTLLFSATIPEKIEDICSKYMTEPLRIEIKTDKVPINQINQKWYEVADDWKFLMLTKLVDNIKPDSCMVFCNTRRKADDVVKKLKQGKYSCAVLHGGLAQRDRLRAIDAFKNKDVNILVATDLAARGIHIDRLDLVINYNIPIDDENYVHRIGRTGRAGAKGEAISLVSVHDKKRWEEIQSYINYKVPKGNSDMLREVESPQKKNSKNKEQNRRKKLHNDIDRIRINAGKKKKIRPGDVLGAVSNLPGIKSEDIGIIDIQDTCSYIEIFNKKGDIAMKGLEKTKVKGKKVTVKKIKGR